MKPKFHPGDRVTVIKPYVAPIPDYVKDSEIFNDLYKVFGLDKDIRGVKPGDTYTIPDTVTIEIEVSLDDKAEAHRIAHKAVELAFKSYAAITKATNDPASITWTDDEIAAARKKVVELSSRVTEQGGDMIFQRSGNTVCCMVYTSSFDDESASKGFAKPFDHDPFNEWIGKCVAACKAMGEPIPGFIAHKNTKQDAA